jgi:hypothetical protein
MLNNARDSYVDLINIKNNALQPRTEGTLLGRRGNNNTPTHRANIKTSFRKKATARSSDVDQAIIDDNNDDLVYYEPCEVDVMDVEEQFPIWEMTGNDPWRNDTNNNNVLLLSLEAVSVENNYSNNCNRSSSSIANCERIFTVPEVYDEIQLMEQHVNGIDTDDQDHEHNIDCFRPWKKQQQAFPIFGMFRNDLHGRQHCTQRSNKSAKLHGEEEHQQPITNDVIKLSTLAVQLYLSLPTEIRQSFHPSMYKVRFIGSELNKSVNNDYDNIFRRACIIGFQRNRIHGSETTSACNDSFVSRKSNNNNRKVYFSELKRVLQVRKFTAQESIDIWYQREDFEYFRSEMTLLVQEDQASRELAEVWLEAHENGSSGTTRQSSSFGSSGKEESSIVGRTTHSRYQWYHQYNHSRRGLERYASPGQARQILASYKVAVQKVLGEQHRQRLLSCLCIPGSHNPDRIAKVYIEYTAWSRDLALAAGASDADAVRTNFDDDKRHTREYFMLKQVVACGFKVHKHMPQFMYPKCITPSGYLDETESLYSLDDADKKGRPVLLLLDTITNSLGRSNKSKATRKDVVTAQEIENCQQQQQQQLAGGNAKQSQDFIQQSMAEKAKYYPFLQAVKA